MIQISKFSDTPKLNQEQIAIEWKNSNTNTLFESQSFRKPNRSSYNIVPLIKEVFNFQDDDFLNRIEQTLIKIDNLAISVDSIIDNSKEIDHRKLSINTQPVIKDMLVKSLSLLSNDSFYSTIKKEIFECVNIAFVNNTFEREYSYSLSTDNSTYKSTMIYLYPLINIIFRKNGVNTNLRPLLDRITCYIQIIDDFQDFQQDLANGINTPITRWVTITNNSTNLFTNELFTLLIENTITKLNSILVDIRLIIKALPCNKVNLKPLEDWETFQSNFSQLKISPIWNEDSIGSYMGEFRQIIIPVLFYY